MFFYLFFYCIFSYFVLKKFSVKEKYKNKDDNITPLSKNGV